MLIFSNELEVVLRVEEKLPLILNTQMEKVGKKCQNDM